MEIKTDRLSLFFDKIKNIGFWQRIFGWRQVRALSYDAYEEFKKLEELLDRTLRDSEQAKSSVVGLSKENEYLKSEKIKLESSLQNINKEFDAAGQEISGLKSSIAAKDEKIRSSDKKIADQDKELVLIKEHVTQLTNNVEQFKKENIVFKQTEADRKIKYENDVAGLNTIRTQIQSDRQKEQEERQRSEIQRIESMKETWSKHQASVQETIKMICQKHTIEYIDQVPFKGKPDNTIQISEEYIIFDAKSPSSDDLKNFPIYIKTQTESVKKYVKEANVRKDIFLVIPSNTVDVIDNFSFNMADYNVYIVTIDVLEPLILALRKIEDYEFVEQLTPEDRENICRIIGKFAHITKRKMQVDLFFTKELIDVLKKCEANLPQDIMGKVVEYEKSEKINPPRESRAKQILTQELEAESESIQVGVRKLPIHGEIGDDPESANP